MFEYILLIGICVVMAKIASADDQSGMTWFFVTFFLCMGSLLIPLPFIRLLIAGVLSFAAMIGYKMYAAR